VGRREGVKSVEKSVTINEWLVYIKYAGMPGQQIDGLTPA